MTEQHDGKLTVGDTNVDLPRVAATAGNDGLSIATVLGDTGTVTYDPGFMNTANARSAITYIDGENGILRYRGYPIEELAEHSSFLEVAYLLIYGELPNAEQLADWDQNIRSHTMLHEDIKAFFDGFPANAHPMAVLSSAVSALSTFYEDSLDPFDEEQVHISTIRLMSKVPVLAAYAYKKSIGQPFLYPDNSLNLTENFLRLTLDRTSTRLNSSHVVISYAVSFFYK